MNDLSHLQQGLGGRGSIGKIKQYLKCDAARALFPDQRAVGYPDVIRNEGFVGVIPNYSVVSAPPLYKEHY